MPESIQRNISKLIECLDVDNGLADCLISRGVLSSEQYQRLTNKSFLPSYQEQNRELLSKMLPSTLRSENKCKMFLSALLETEQRHIFNFLMISEGLQSTVSVWFPFLVLNVLCDVDPAAFLQQGNGVQGLLV